MQDHIKKLVVQRLKKIEGQVRGVQALVEKDAYCVDVITQAQAIKSAVGAVERLMLKNHLETHVVEQMRGKNQSRAVDEILKVYKLSQTK